MRTRAAVAVKAGQPLEIMDVNLEGPKRGEVLDEINHDFELMHQGKSIRAVVEF